jgi:hypothetical protein
MDTNRHELGKGGKDDGARLKVTGRCWAEVGVGRLVLSIRLLLRGDFQKFSCFDIKTQADRGSFSGFKTNANISSIY